VDIPLSARVRVDDPSFYPCEISPSAEKVFFLAITRQTGRISSPGDLRWYFSYFSLLPGTIFIQVFAQRFMSAFLDPIFLYPPYTLNPNTCVQGEYALSVTPDENIVRYFVAVTTPSAHFFLTTFVHTSSREWVLFDLRNPPPGKVLKRGFHTFEGEISYRVLDPEVAVVGVQFISRMRKKEKDSFVPVESVVYSFGFPLKTQEGSIPFTRRIQVPGDSEMIRVKGFLSRGDPGNPSTADEVFFDVAP
jgi:hypothetical protein